VSSERVKLKVATCQRIDVKFPGARKASYDVVRGGTKRVPTPSIGWSLFLKLMKLREAG